MSDMPGLDDEDGDDDEEDGDVVVESEEPKCRSATSGAMTVHPFVESEVGDFSFPWYVERW